MEKKPKNLWKYTDTDKYQLHVTVSTVRTECADETIVYMEDLEKRKEAYGICGECNEPGTGEYWCQPCNAKRFKDNFKNWTSGNKNVDEFIQQSQLNAIHFLKYLEWIPFEKFQNITYIAEGGFGKIYSAEWSEGYIYYWDIENQKWYRYNQYNKYILKSLYNSSDICTEFLGEIKSYLQVYLEGIVPCYGITQNPNTKEYMMVLYYCEKGNLRDYLNESEFYINYKSKINKLLQIAKGLLDIHNAGSIHKDFHSGNILHDASFPFISDLGMCQPANKQSVKEEGIYGVLPYMAPEVLCGHQYTKAADIYSFGIIMNELLSEEIPFNDISHDQFLAIKIYKGFRPNISKDVPELLAELIIKCWDAETENRPTTKELYQLLVKWDDEINNIKSNYYDSDDSDDNYSENIENNQNNQNSEIYFQVKECDKIGKQKFKSRLNKNKSVNILTHPQAIYTSRLLNFKNLPKPVNSSNLSFQFNSDADHTIQSISSSVQLTELELNEFWQK
ncbi:hypothetical protein RclHR1_01810022 [Rhizophagus clarus]|uniref:Protein kinase domain-containing protein n=1 Tax=Rhizophagus clarus TaxID=94130 RepID=A0A2Z6QZ11_9GLOM|nr:hypothetical protein RclHR1_01810022 [Rhizophagus clarus]